MSTLSKEIYTVKDMFEFLAVNLVKLSIKEGATAIWTKNNSRYSYIFEITDTGDVIIHPEKCIGGPDCID